MNSELYYRIVEWIAPLMLYRLPGFILFLLCVAMLCVVLLIIGLCYYIIMRIATKHTEMRGIMRMGVALNKWPESGLSKDAKMLTFGQYFIPIQDAKDVKTDRVAPKLSFLELAQVRKYRIGTLLHRFQKAYENAGLTGAGNDALQEILRDVLLCNNLGYLSGNSRQSGFRVIDMMHNDDWKLRPAGSGVDIYLRIPEAAQESLKNSTGLTAESICLSLTYYKKEGNV